MGPIDDERGGEELAVRDAGSPHGQRDAEMRRRAAPGRNAVEPPLRERLRRLAEWQERFVTVRGLGERLHLLVAFGLTDHDIAKVVPNAQPRSVRRWRAQGPPTTRVAERLEPIDDLCATIGFFLANATYDEEGIVGWLRSRNAALDHRRPLDALREGGFDAVREAAEREVELVAVRREDLLPAPGPKRSRGPEGRQV